LEAAVLSSLDEKYVYLNRVICGKEKEKENTLS
jgi:hypothetical protein